MLSVEQLVDAYRAVAVSTGEKIIELGHQALTEVAAKPFALRQGLPAYPTLLNKIAALVQGIVFEKPFPDHNREVARHAMESLLRENGYRLTTTDEALDRLMVGVELGITSTHRITIWLKQHTERDASI